MDSDNSWAVNNHMHWWQSDKDPHEEEAKLLVEASVYLLEGPKIVMNHPKTHPTSFPGEQLLGFINSMGMTIQVPQE